MKLMMEIEWVMNSERIGVNFVNFGCVLREIKDFGVRVLKKKSYEEEEGLFG